MAITLTLTLTVKLTLTLTVNSKLTRMVHVAVLSYGEPSTYGCVNECTFSA